MKWTEGKNDYIYFHYGNTDWNFSAGILFSFGREYIEAGFKVGNLPSMRCFVRGSGRDILLYPVADTIGAGVL